MYFVEGPKTMFRVALAILSINEAKLLKEDIAGVFNILRTYHEQINIDELWNVAFNRYKFSKARIE